MKYEGTIKLDFVARWCSDNNVSYKDFQCMETLGYLQVYKNYEGKYSVRIIDKYMYDLYLSNNSERRF